MIWMNENKLMFDLEEANLMSDSAHIDDQSFVEQS